MKIQLTGELIEHEDGSATAKLDVDEEGKFYLMQLGLEVLIKRSIEKDKYDTSGT